MFEGPDGELRLIDMFEGHPQLYIHHFMWIDAVDKGCPSCTMAADLTFTEKDRALLDAKGVTFAAVSRAPYASIAGYKAEHAWTFPWYSSRDNDFTYDFHVTLDPKRAAIEYNYKSIDELHVAGFDDAVLRGDWRAPACFCGAVTRCSTPIRRSRGAGPLRAWLSVPIHPYGGQRREDSPAGPQGVDAVGVPDEQCDQRDPKAGIAPHGRSRSPLRVWLSG